MFPRCEIEIFSWDCKKVPGVFELILVRLSMTKQRLAVLVAILFLSGAGAWGNQHETGNSASRNSKKVVFILLDGARPDVLEKLIEKNEMPILANLKESGTWVDTAISVFPSTTGPAYAPYVSGLYPDKSGLSGIRQYIRSTGTYRSYCGTDLTKIKDDMNPDYKTIFEILPPNDTLSVVGMVDRGAKNSNTPTIPFAFNSIQGKFLECDKAILKMLLQKTQKGLPRFTFVSFHSTDSFGHKKGAESPEYLSAMRNMDSVVGQFIDHCKKIGEYENLVLIVSADHGIESTDKHGNLAQTMGKLGYNVQDAIPRNTFFFNLKKKQMAREKDAIFAVSGNACVQIYLKGKVLQMDNHEEGKFTVRPSLEQIRNYPIGKKREKTHDLISVFRKEPCVGFLVVRDGRDQLRVFSRTGEGLITREEKGFTYQVISDPDPLQLGKWARKYCDRKALTGRQWMKMTGNDPYPDVIFQLWQFMQGENSGDIIVNAAPGYEPWNEGQRGVHGGAGKAQMRLPLLIWGKGIPAKRLPCARTVDIFPTIFRILDVQTPRGIPGIPLL